MQTANVLAEPKFDAQKWNKVGLVKTNQIAADCFFLKAGQGHRWHRHPDADKVVMCLSGEGELLVDEAQAAQRTELRPGVVALVPRGAWHRMAATSADMIALTAQKFPFLVEEK